MHLLTTTPTMDKYPVITEMVQIQITTGNIIIKNIMWWRYLQMWKSPLTFLYLFITQGYEVPLVVERKSRGEKLLTYIRVHVDEVYFGGGK